MGGNPPVVVGGGGGSGTRVVAQIMQRCGYFIGPDLNEAYDNLWFTLLFRRPGWFAGAEPSEVQTAIRVFDRAMMGRPADARGRVGVILNAMLPMVVRGSDYKRRLRGKWPLVRAWRLWRGAGRAAANGRAWGWKEPNSHVYLPHLLVYYPEMKYVHVIRHGLDMALSSNQAQLYNWGPRFRVEPPKSKEEEPRAAFDYWVVSNRQAISFGQAHLGDRFLLVDFDRLCASPMAEVGRLLRFLDAGASDDQVSALAEIPRRPTSTGRYKNRDPSVFGKDALQALEAFGFVWER